MSKSSNEESVEDIRYRLYVLDEIRRGSEEIERGEGIEHEEVKRRLAKWLDERRSSPR